jgi:hypothetical protein
VNASLWLPIYSTAVGVSLILRHFATVVTEGLGGSAPIR